MHWDLEISAALRCMLLSSLCTEKDWVSEKSRDLSKWQWFLSAALRSLLLSWLQRFLQRLQSQVLKGWGERCSILHLFFLLETFDSIWGYVWLPCFEKGDAIGIQWMEGRDAAKRSAMHRTAHHNREFNQSDMSTVPRLGNLPARLRKRKGKETNPQERVHGFFRTCWLETLEASWVESETGLHTKRARRPKKEADTPDC